MAEDMFAQKGWICPKCGRVHAPSMMFCLWCCNDILEAYSRGFEDGAEAVKAGKIKALHEDYIEPYVTIEDEPQTDCSWRKPND